MAPQGRRTPPQTRRDGVFIRVSKAHHEVAGQIAASARWTLRTTAEAAIEELARKHGLSVDRVTAGKGRQRSGTAVAL